jgi:hypothetical protein
LTTIISVDDAADRILEAPVYIPSEYGFLLDSVFIFGKPESPQELEYIFAYSENPGRYIRLLVWNNDAPNALPYPPIIDRQPCSHRTVALGGTQVYHAYRDARYGQHEAVWRRGHLTFMLLSKPTIETTISWFECFMSKVLR